MRTKGIDVSYHNGKINWEKVKSSGMDFAYIRLGYSGYEGEIHMDKNFFENFEGAERAGLKVGVYIYSYNRDEKSARRTAQEAREILKDYKPQLPVAFDVEETGHSIFTSKSKEENSRLCLSFFEEIKRAGFDGILYSYTNFIKNHIDMSLLKDYELWIADYRDKSGLKCPYEGSFAIWQYMGSEGKCDGVEGPCDLNYCYREFDKETDYRAKYEALKSQIEELIEKYKKITAS